MIQSQAEKVKDASTSSLLDGVRFLMFLFGEYEKYVEIQIKLCYNLKAIVPKWA